MTYLIRLFNKFVNIVESFRCYGKTVIIYRIRAYRNFEIIKIINA